MIDTVETRLGRQLADWNTLDPRNQSKSGYYPLVSGNDAFGARLALIDMADRSIDAQYFLMKQDSAGLVFSGSLLRAADRGVRVRLLLDDVFTSVEDSNLDKLDQHRNIEVRLFNPISRRGFFYLNYLADFERANRRMHNKSFIVDNQVSVIGGRNIADEYFELEQKVDFKDFDMLAVGSITRNISDMFGRFWNHELSVPMEAFRAERNLGNISDHAVKFSEKDRALALAVYENAVNSQLLQQLLEKKIALFAADGELITDNPEKILNRVSPDQQLLATKLAEIVANANSEVLVFTPYFIPGSSGVEFWRRLANKGVRVVILTNSLASNNHIPVHAAYARYRRDIIRAGVELYELRVNAPSKSNNPGTAEIELITLHTKLVIVDRKFTTVGSLNLDPRSIDINTEVALVVDSADLAQQLASPALELLPSAAYRLTERGKRQLLWNTIVDGVEVSESREPDVGRWRRFKAFVSRIFPESQL